MTTGAYRWPVTDLDIAAALRVQLDQAIAKHANLERTLALRDERIAQLERDVIPGLRAEGDALRRTLLGEAELAESQAEPHEKRGSAWWYAAWREVSRHRSELQHRLQNLERWMLEGGREATRLQRDLDAARQEIGELSRQLDRARSGEQPGDDQGDDVDEDAPTVIPTGEEIH